MKTINRFAQLTAKLKQHQLLDRTQASLIKAGKGDSIVENLEADDDGK